LIFRWAIAAVLFGNYTINHCLNMPQQLSTAAIPVLDPDDVGTVYVLQELVLKEVYSRDYCDIASFSEELGVASFSEFGYLRSRAKRDSIGSD